MIHLFGDSWYRNEMSIGDDGLYVSCNKLAGSLHLEELLSSISGNIADNAPSLNFFDLSGVHTEYIRVPKAVEIYYQYSRKGEKIAVNPGKSIEKICLEKVQEFTLRERSAFVDVDTSERSETELYSSNSVDDIVVYWNENLGSCIPSASVDTLFWTSTSQIPNFKKELKERYNSLIVLLDVEVLRRHGAFITKGISWEKTILETIWQCTQLSKFESLRMSDIFIITFGISGVLVFDNRNDAHHRLFWYHPELMETDNNQMDITEVWSELLALIVYNFDLEKFRFIEKFGWILSLMQENIKGRSLSGMINGPFEFYDDFYYSIVVPPYAGKRIWKIAEAILNDEGTPAFQNDIIKLAQNGVESRWLRCPIMRIGDLVSVDRFEIEGFMNIRNLISQYVETNSAEKPLCFAVFGQPGSGKSFGIRQIAKTIAPQRIKFLEYNISQYQSIQELNNAFYDIQEISLNGDLPLVFFDEFDADGFVYVKQFLMPMQDGFFVDRGVKRSIGKCILVFAGGVCRSISDFQEKSEAIEFADKKVPDFISRLRGYVNILGLNRNEVTDKSFLLRRAIVLSGLCERKNNLRIDEDVLRALLFTKVYKFGTRSLQAIFEMSKISNDNRLKISSLPSMPQLELHVDSQNFESLLTTVMIDEEIQLRIAKELVWIDFGNERKWSDLNIKEQGEYYSESSEIIELLENILHLNIYLNADTARMPPNALETGSISDKQYILFSEILHAFDYYSLRLDGWSYGIELNKQQKTTPYLSSWDTLESVHKDFYKEKVKRAISAIRNPVMCLLNQSFTVNHKI